MLSQAALFSLLLVAGLQVCAAPQAEEKNEQKKSVFTAGTNLVSLDVTVTDKKGRPIQGLRREDFRVFEDTGEQDAAFFSHETKAVSWGVVLDRSGSMVGLMDDVYRAALHSIEAGTPKDETFIMAFNQDIDIVQDFTPDRGRLLSSIKRIYAGGSTALYDAVALALESVQRGRHQKRVLVVVTDGDDNASRFSFNRLLDLARERETLIYVVGFFESSGMSIGKLIVGRSREELTRLAEQSGGMAYFPKNMQECDRACRDIAQQVSRQYSLGYYPKNSDWDGRWREIKVEVRHQKNSIVRARAGYFARFEDQTK